MGDPTLLATITRKMINHLCWRGVDEAIDLLKSYVGDISEAGQDEEQNRPLPRHVPYDVASHTGRAFRIASEHLSDEEITRLVDGWKEEDKAAALVEILDLAHYGVQEIATSLQKFAGSDFDERALPMSLKRGLGASLLRRVFSDNLAFLGLLKDRVSVSDFAALMRRVIYTSRSRGKLGGKSSGLFLASTMLHTLGADRPELAGVRTPKTWYMTSDGVLEFLRHNNLEDVHAQKYLDLERVRADYPHLVTIFKNSRFPTELVSGVMAALDDLGDFPLIVRSSSLLEDQVGAAFSGKYKSLFIANRGTRSERLSALLDAIAEVYCSIFAPDPMEYRAERGLLDVHEEMGVMIQQVVGVKLGRYYLPAYAGVAFSRNEFRWSPRIRREDGLIRMVPGLGTRAVDRLGDDYPVLIAPGQPGLRVNVSHEEIIRYSPQKIDVINLEENDFQTVPIRDLLAEVGEDYPSVRSIVSMVSDGYVRRPVGLEPDWGKDEVAVTFAGLIEDGDVIKRIGHLLQFLEETLGYPVDIEFASDGKDLYLLQCRALSASLAAEPSPIPRNLPTERVLFSANKYVSNGRIPDLTHLVYVDPEAYAGLQTLAELKDVARAVGRLNHILPRRHFVLIGPGRWGSRGDIKLGVSVGYGDINNTAALIELAWRRGNYTPEPSFGTHFFLDLVEADIRYLPIYPDDRGVIFNQEFFSHAESVLVELLPEYAHLEHVVRVIDVQRATGGQIVRLLLNADVDVAVALLASPSPGHGEERLKEFEVEQTSADHKRWRLLMAERLAETLDAPRFGVKAMYVTGSVCKGTAGPASDLDLLVHFVGSEEQRAGLLLWIDGWSRSLAEVNFLRTGYTSDALIDVDFVTDEDIAGRRGPALLIELGSDSALRLNLRGRD